MRPLLKEPEGAINPGSPERCLLPPPHPTSAFVVPTACDLWPLSWGCSQESCPLCPQASAEAPGTCELCGVSVPASPEPVPKPAALLRARPSLSRHLVLCVPQGSESRLQPLAKQLFKAIPDFGDPQLNSHHVSQEGASFQARCSRQAAWPGCERASEPPSCSSLRAAGGFLWQQPLLLS